MARNMQPFRKLCIVVLVSACFTCALLVEARSVSVADDASISGVIPSPNQNLGDEFDDIQRTSAVATSPPKSSGLTQLEQRARLSHHQEQQLAEPSNGAAIPVYISPFARADQPSHFEHSQESSEAPLNYAPTPSAHDLKTSASYGHGHHHGHHGHHHSGYDHSGWLDMGAWTGGKGSFGWYADYPVGGKHHGYGRK